MLTEVGLPHGINFRNKVPSTCSSGRALWPVLEEAAESNEAAGDAATVEHTETGDGESTTIVSWLGMCWAPNAFCIISNASAAVLHCILVFAGGV